MAHRDTFQALVFEPLIKELSAKIKQLEDNVKSASPPTRKELEIFVWKTTRVTRGLVKPEASPAREIFWNECKGVLKKVVVFEKFNPGVFLSESVKDDIYESTLLETIKKLKHYTHQRMTGKIEAPKEILTTEMAFKKQKLKEEEEEKAKKKQEEDWWAQEDLKWSSVAEDVGKRWDEEVSDVEEECPDKKKYGDCIYGRTCGFCNRLG